ncbi:unnamed protein product [Macrosiphum euphorbiae]|uniref:Uncharacterized protein n=1 Tax=Macrosiphum euphorbiae TaxID=13131 RepID=A0AAV0VIW7_9HEMI|nr:unnamed protein product [Macrosiphum euphorbiae]
MDRGAGIVRGVGIGMVWREKKTIESLRECAAVVEFAPPPSVRLNHRVAFLLENPHTHAQAPPLRIQPPTEPAVFG